MFKCLLLCFLISVFSDCHILSVNSVGSKNVEQRRFWLRNAFVLHFFACCNPVVDKGARLVVSPEPHLTNPLVLCPAVDTPTEPAKPPMLARMPLVAGALQDLLAKLKQYTTAKEHHLLAISSMPAPNDKAGSDELAQQWQARIHN
jgi:hypothetical protein